LANDSLNADSRGAQGCQEQVFYCPFEKGTHNHSSRRTGLRRILGNHRAIIWLWASTLPYEVLSNF